MTLSFYPPSPPLFSLLHPPLPSPFPTGIIAFSAALLPPPPPLPQLPFPFSPPYWLQIDEIQNLPLHPFLFLFSKVPSSPSLERGTAAHLIMASFSLLNPLSCQSSTLELSCCMIVGVFFFLFFLFPGGLFPRAPQGQAPDNSQLCSPPPFFFFPAFLLVRGRDIGHALPFFPPLFQNLFLLFFLSLEWEESKVPSLTLPLAFPLFSPPL